MVADAGRSLVIVADPSHARHWAPGHPERPDRVDAILVAIAADPQLRAVPVIDPVSINDDDILAVHSAAERERVAGLSAAGGGWFDADTFATSASYSVALRAVGAALRGIDEVATRRYTHAFSVMRPPGHHATATTPMGFCLFNNVALAVRHAQARHGIERIAVIDIDVHHGNGLQDIFYDDPSVLYCSLHQRGLYPRSGHEGEQGTGPGVGATINVTLPAGASGSEWLTAFDARILPAVAAFAPGLILVSAGYDAHERDPLADLSLSTATYGEIAMRIVGLCRNECRGSVWALEGGYDLTALSDSVVETLRCLHSHPVGAVP